MCSVFNKILQSDREKAFVIAHEKDYSAQSIYAKSVKASLDSFNLLSCVASTRIDSSA